MKRSRFTETQIVSILKEADAGTTVKDFFRQHVISDATFYNWKSKYDGMSASELNRLNETEADLSQYRKMYAELARENYALKDLIGKSSDIAGALSIGIRPFRGHTGSLPDLFYHRSNGSRQGV